MIKYTFQKMFHVGQKNIDIVDQIICMLEDTRHYLENTDIESMAWPIYITIIIIIVSKFFALTYKLKRTMDIYLYQFNPTAIDARTSFGKIKG